ncbi:hypothetical protein C3K47_10435 [Solitalea longa]|uniref:Uncharacterized protein n=1 Tax=Solitalea longa TaxID=2079460 RepID=A0A2S5A2H2_9SPHI|nr:hypothetical protein C3K47_10435 [Solitalea longa]
MGGLKQQSIKTILIQLDPYLLNYPSMQLGECNFLLKLNEIQNKKTIINRFTFCCSSNFILRNIRAFKLNEEVIG